MRLSTPCHLTPKSASQSEAILSGTDIKIKNSAARNMAIRVEVGGIMYFGKASGRRFVRLETLRVRSSGWTWDIGATVFILFVEPPDGRGKHRPRTISQMLGHVIRTCAKNLKRPNSIDLSLHSKVQSTKRYFTTKSG